MKLDRTQAPALGRHLDDGSVLLGDLLRSPEDRDRRLEVVPLLLLRSDEAVLTPADDTVLEADDELLFAGAGAQRRELESTMIVDATASYVLFDQRVPASWVWRKLSRKTPAEPAERCSRRRSSALASAAEAAALAVPGQPQVTPVACTGQ